VSNYSAKEIIEIKEELANTPGTQQRLSSYEAIARALGRETMESERFAYITAPTTREHAPWERADDDTDLLVNIPFLHQIIEDQRTVLGAMRSHRVPLPIPSNTEAQLYSDKLERGIAHLWRMWQMPVFLSEAAWYAVCFGTGIGVLRWDKGEKVPMPTVRSPENFIAQADPEDSTRVQIGIFIQKTLGRMLNLQYADKKLDLAPDQEYEVIDYYDKDMRYRCIEGVEENIIEAKNPLDTVPIYMFRSIAIPNSLFGASNLTKTIPIQDELNRLYSKQAEYLDDVMNAPTFIKDPDEVPANFTWNKHAVVTMGPQGAIGKAPIASIDPRVFEYRMEDMKHNLDNAMDFSNLSRGEYHQEVSGKGVVALKSGTQQRMMMRLQTFDPQIERMTEDALMLWKKKGKAGGIYGSKGGSMFTDLFDPKADIDPNWLHVYVYLDSSAYIDRQAAQVTNLQKARGNPPLMSTRRFLELDPDCDDVEAEMQRIKDEVLEMAQIQAQAMMAQQPQMPPDQQALSAEKGGAVEGAAPPEGIPGSAPPAPVPGEPGPPPGAEPGGEEDVTPAVADVFRSASKVKGEVWLVGEYLEGGISADEFADGYIDLYISDPLDKATLLNFLKSTELAGAVQQQRLVFHEDREFLEAHPRLNVSPGTSGYEIEGGEMEEMPEEEMPMGMEPEEMNPMAAMGGGMPGGGMPPGMPPMM
jgi:hypothetical protein